MDRDKLTSDYYVTVVEQGLGRNELTLTLIQLESFVEATFISQICWAVVIWIVKYSILAFYWRLFSANRRTVRVIIWSLTALVTCWGIAVVRFCFSPLIGRAIFLYQDGVRRCLTMN